MALPEESKEPVEEETDAALGIKRKVLRPMGPMDKKPKKKKDLRPYQVGSIVIIIIVVLAAFYLLNISVKDDSGFAETPGDEGETSAEDTGDPVNTGSEATGGADESEATGGRDESEATGGADESDETGGADESDETGGADESDETGGADESDETGGSTEEFDLKVAGGMFVPQEIKVERGDEVTINLQAFGSARCLKIDEFGVDEIVPLGETGSIVFSASKEGTFIYYCNRPGIGSYRMMGQLIVS